jgi:hypothetical protein
MDAPPHCRFCQSPLRLTLVDLGATPLANSFVTAADIAAGRDRKFPLRVRVCGTCLLVQVDDSVAPDAIFSDYAYFSSYSDGWVRHAQRYAEAMIERFGLGHDSMVVEVASNDGYLLQHFKARSIPILGIEPAQNVAATALQKGIPTEVAFFGQDCARRLSKRGIRAHLMAANNVLAHVPNIRDFVTGFSLLLADDGVATFEFPHLLNLIKEVQFDTIYHEHFSYLSLIAVERIFAACGLRIFDVQEITTHGGSLRLFACRHAAPHALSPRVEEVRNKEKAAHLHERAGYEGFAEKVAVAKRSFQTFLAQVKAQQKRLCAYGAAAKGNTFLNVCGVSPSDILCVFDRSLEKQGKFLPGSHIPVVAPEKITEMRPDFLLILPWNIADEVRSRMVNIAQWGGQFVVAIPETHILTEPPSK